MTLKQSEPGDIWPVETIKLGKPIPALSTKLHSLLEADEVFCVDYLANDSKSGYIFIESYDGRSKTLIRKLKKYGLDELVDFVRKGEILLMW